MKAAQEPEYFDKEFLRLWFKAHSDPYKDESLPEAPPDMVEEMSNRYIGMYEQITGTKFVKGAVPITQRLENNLAKYAV
jgi:phosphoribosylaminoimidazole-succinocarboxamide synthase